MATMRTARVAATAAAAAALTTRHPPSTLPHQGLLYLYHDHRDPPTRLPAPSLPLPPAQPSGRSARLASRFIDRITLRVSGGTGGPGATSFARGPNQAVAPPDGGHGGDGGAVTLVASTGASSLDLPSRSVTAGSGGAGRPARAAGRRGTDAVIEVPLGTAVVAWSAAARRVVPVADLDTPGAAAVVARGGKGGRGNGGRRAPARGGSSSADWGEEGWGRPAAGGMPGDSRTLGLELKVLADVGLVGLPNAGKSTLLGAISRASPRVGAWAFTTLRPTVGVVAAPAGGGSSPREGAAGGDASGGGGSGANRGSGTFRVADIPGLVAGAAADRGLGHAFLRHVERTRLLLYVVDASDRRSGDDGDADRVDGTTPAADWAVLRSELAAYGGGGLASRRCLVVATKMDTPGAAAGVADLAAAVGAGFEVWPVCASAGWGVPPLLARIAAVLEEERQREGGSMDEGGVERGGVGRWTAAELGVDPDAPLDDGNWEGGG
ncbi:hypothetical protein MMPV_005006 [Pyropia vietnamensis]